jgi:hypothetical protein
MICICAVAIRPHTLTMLSMDTRFTRTSCTHETIRFIFVIMLFLFCALWKIQIGFVPSISVQNCDAIWLNSSLLIQQDCGKDVGNNSILSLPQIGQVKISTPWFGRHDAHHRQELHIKNLLYAGAISSCFSWPSNSTSNMLTIFDHPPVSN